MARSRRRVRDTATGRVGEVMDHSPSGQSVSLRPVGGGVEWIADRDAIEPVDVDQEDVDPPEGGAL